MALEHSRCLEYGRCELRSRNRHVFMSFSDLAQQLGSTVTNRTAVFDGEIVCLDRRGHPRFNDLLFHRREPCFVAFNLLWCDGKDLRHERLLDRKLELRRLLGRARGPVIYADQIETFGYIHPSDERVLEAISVLGGREFENATPYFGHVGSH